jgi:mannose-6-phosphate isomerase-like protein (cupin superfamily)
MEDVMTAVTRTRYAEVAPYLTKDGSIIRELMHPAVHGNRAQSLAEAIVPVGAATRLHRHRRSEEIYHVVAGTGRMTRGAEQFDVAPGDTVAIAPGTAHCVANTGTEPLRILCACTPPYDHDDTQLD